MENDPTLKHAVGDLLTRGVAEVIDRTNLEKRLLAGQKLRIKFGIDPSKPELHIGHAVPLRKLREFQDMGHTTIMLFGDYTAQLGDPSDKSEARKLLSAEETKKNAESYLAQVFKILDPNKTEVRYNSEWLNKFTLRDTIELMSKVTVNHLLSHETFAKRLHGAMPLYYHEMFYSLMQGYDSVELKADVELGGMDQKFNILMGRTLQRAHNQPEQDIMLFKYLPGTDGNAKMSKSLGNTINIGDKPVDMFGKVMSISDSLMPIYFELATTLPEEMVTELLEKSKTAPREVKVALAKQIVSEYHSPAEAETALEHFNRVFRDKKMPEDMETLMLNQGEHDLLDILVSRSTLVSSKSEARRVIAQKGVRVNKEVIEDISFSVSPKLGEEVVIQVGSRRFLKVVWK